MLPRTIAAVSPLVSQQLDNTSGRVIWWAFAETTGSATAQIQLWDGSSNGGNLLLPVNLNANESVSDSSGPFGIPYETGLWVQVVNGSVEGTVQVIDLSEHPRDVRPAFLVGELDINVYPPQGR